MREVVPRVARAAGQKPQSRVQLWRLARRRPKDANGHVRIESKFWNAAEITRQGIGRGSSIIPERPGSSIASPLVRKAYTASGLAVMPGTIGLGKCSTGWWVIGLRGEPVRTTSTRPWSAPGSRCARGEGRCFLSQCPFAHGRGAGEIERTRRDPQHVQFGGNLELQGGDGPPIDPRGSWRSVPHRLRSRPRCTPREP